jgi:hypothetical protein
MVAGASRACGAKCRLALLMVLDDDRRPHQRRDTVEKTEDRDTVETKGGHVLKNNKNPKDYNHSCWIIC